IPWNLLCDRPANDASAFWANRFVLTSGRRVNALRQTPLLEAPTRLLVVDEDLALDAADEEMRRRWQDAGEFVGSADGLAARLREGVPDILVLVGRAGKDCVRLGAD